MTTDTHNHTMALVAEVVDLWRMRQLAADEALERVRVQIEAPAEPRAFGSEDAEIYDKGLG